MCRSKYISRPIWIEGDVVDRAEYVQRVSILAEKQDGYGDIAFTHVAGTRDRSGKGSEGSWEGSPSVRCFGRPCRRQEDRTDSAPGHPQLGSLSEVAEGEHRQRKQTVDQPARGRKHQTPRPGWPGQPGRQHAPAPRQPCAGLLPPSCGLSIPCGSP